MYSDLLRLSNTKFNFYWSFFQPMNDGKSLETREKASNRNDLISKAISTTRKRVFFFKAIRNSFLFFLIWFIACGHVSWCAHPYVTRVTFPVQSFVCCIFFYFFSFFFFATRLHFNLQHLTITCYTHCNWRLFTLVINIFLSTQTHTDLFTFFVKKKKNFTNHNFKHVSKAQKRKSYKI